MKKKPRALRAAAKIAAAARTAWNRYSIHDRKAVLKRIEAQHHVLKLIAAKAAEKGKSVLVPDLHNRLTRDHNKYARHIGAQSKYVPYQGAGECARRVRQSLSPWARAGSTYN